MILKEKETVSAMSEKRSAGVKQEQDVAFYLRRSYKTNALVMVLNDIRVTHDGETAQIDHLIVYPYGFIVVESKSIRGEVRVNERDEWSRSYNGQWTGMPSPIKQAELQLKILKSYLRDHTHQLLGKLIIGVQKGFGGRCYDVFCAISSDAIIDRGNASAKTGEKLVKSEFVTDALDKIMDFKKSYNLAAKIFDTRPDFTQDEMQKICSLLLNNKPVSDTGTQDEPHQNTKPVKNDVTMSTPQIKPSSINVQCKKCGEFTGLSPHAGKFGYYAKCAKCGGNTPLKLPCPSCKSQETKVSKSQSQYLLKCNSCSCATVLSLAPS